MKAVIPVAGAGTKLRPLTFTQPKPLIPVAGKPIIAFIIDQLRGVGVDDFVFIIGYLGDKIIDYVETNYPKLKKSFVFQSQRKGLGHALWVANDELEDAKEIIVVLGDTIIDTDLKSFVAMEGSCLATKKVADPRNFGVVELNADGKASHVVEKPVIPKSNLAMVGMYKFTNVPKLLDALQYLIDNEILSHNEYQLTDAIARMIELKEEFSTMDVKLWFDCGKTDMLLATNSLLLDRYGYFKNKTYNFENTVIIPPVSIGDDCEIKNAIIGPNVSIGHNANINNTILRDSIIGNYSRLQDIFLEYSVIGNDTRINGKSKKLNIGDDSEIDLT